MDAGTMAAEAVAARLERQEEDIRRLWAEVQRLRDEQLSAPDQGRADGPSPTREVAQLRAENRDLRLRLGRLRLCLAEELSRRAGPGSAAPGEAGRAGAQPSPIQSQEKDTKKQKLKENGFDGEVKQPDFIKERLKLFETLKKDHQHLLSIHEKRRMQAL